MKSIETLIEDIQRILSTPTDIPAEALDVFKQQLSETLIKRLAKQERSSDLSMSGVGIYCDRKSWYKHNNEQGEDLPAETYLKFIFGDILEALLLLLAKTAGHTVQGEQDTMTLGGIEGHRDAVIDGVTTDVKSASSMAYYKFFHHLNPVDDKFGYIDQLGSYVQSSRDDPLVLDKRHGAFFVVDKQLGKICLDIHDYKDKDYEQIIQRKVSAVNQKTAPTRAYTDEPEGKGGNRKLGTVCSYCEFKTTCWPGIRGFKYAKGPVYLTQVSKLPDVPEIELHGTYEDIS